MKTFQVTSRLTCKTFYVKANDANHARSKVMNKGLKTLELSAHDNLYVHVSIDDLYNSK